MVSDQQAKRASLWGAHWEEAGGIEIVQELLAMVGVLMGLIMICSTGIV